MLSRRYATGCHGPARTYADAGPLPEPDGSEYRVIVPLLVPRLWINVGYHVAAHDLKKRHSTGQPKVANPPINKLFARATYRNLTEVPSNKLGCVFSGRTTVRIRKM